MTSLANTKVKEEEPVLAVLLDKDPEEENRARLDPIVAEVPAEMWKPLEEDIILFLDTELSLAEAERSGFMDDLSRFRVAYAAPMATSPKNFPIANSSNLIMPVIKEAVNVLAAQVVQAIATVRPRWVYEGLADEWDPFIKEIQRFMDISSDRELKFEEIITDGTVDKVKFGTSIYEVYHEVIERKVYRYTQTGKEVYPKVIVYKDGPAFSLIPAQKFWIRFHERDVQRAAWCAKEFDFTESDLRTMAAQGEVSGVEDLLKVPDTNSDEVTKTQEEIENKEPIRSTFKCFEIWFSFPGSDGDLIEFKVLYHRDTRKFLYKRFNPYNHGLRPFVKDGYFPVPGRFYDMGLCEMLEALQAAISQKHNTRADNATLANLKMILKRKMQKGLQPGDLLYSGKQIEVNDIWNDMREFTLSEIYPSTVAEESILRSTVDRLAGTSEGVAGAGAPVTRTGTGAQLALLQEQSKRIDIPIKGSRRAINQIGFFTMMMYMQHGTNGKALGWMGDKGRIVEAVFRLPQRAVEVGLGIKANVPTSMQNKQVQRENDIAQFNLLVQMYEKLVPLAAQLAPDQIGEVVHGLVRSAKRFMQNALESFDTPDPDEILAGLTVLERILPAPEDLGGLEAFQRGSDSLEILNGIERLERLHAEASATFEGRRRVAEDRRDGKTTALPQGIPTSSFEGIGIGGESAALRSAVREGD